MEKMKARINAMGTEVNCCWKETHKFQDAMKELEDGAFEFLARMMGGSGGEDEGKDKRDGHRS